jgi:hypothetical protein
VLCDIVFDEHAQRNRREDDGAGELVDDTFMIEYIVTHDAPVTEDTKAEARSQHSIGDSPVPGQGGGDRELSGGVHALSKIPSIVSSDIDDDHDPQLRV